MDADTIERCAEAGADVFVAGSAVYGASDPAAAVDALRSRQRRNGAGRTTQAERSQAEQAADRL